MQKQQRMQLKADLRKNIIHNAINRSINSSIEFPYLIFSPAQLQHISGQNNGIPKLLLIFSYIIILLKTQIEGLKALQSSMKLQTLQRKDQFASF